MQAQQDFSVNFHLTYFLFLVSLQNMQQLSPKGVIWCCKGVSTKKKNITECGSKNLEASKSAFLIQVIRCLLTPTVGHQRLIMFWLRRWRLWLSKGTVFTRLHINKVMHITLIFGNVICKWTDTSMQINHYGQGQLERRWFIFIHLNLLFYLK